MGLEVREGGLRKRRRRRIRRRKSKFPHVRAYVIDPFGAAALLPDYNHDTGSADHFIYFAYKLWQNCAYNE